MIFGLASGLGFFYLRADAMSPTRMFHGRAVSLETNLGENTAMDFVDRIEPDNDRAFTLLRARLQAGEPILLSPDRPVRNGTRVR